MAKSRPMLQVLALCALTTATNAAAISPSTFGGAPVTLVLAAATLALAAVGILPAGRDRTATPDMAATPEDPLDEADGDARAVLRWGRWLAALVAVFCTTVAVLH